MTINTNYYLQRFNLDQSILRGMLAKLQAANIPLDKNGAYDWDNISDDYCAYYTLDQNGQQQTLTLRDQYNLVTTYLGDSENNLNILGLEKELKFWKDEKVSLKTKAVRLGNIVNEQFFESETSRASLSRLVDEYQLGQQQVSRETSKLTSSRKDVIRLAIDAYNKSVMDPLRSSLHKPAIYKNFQQLTSPYIVAQAGADQRRIENFVLANLTELSSAPYQSGLKQGNDDQVASINFSKRLVELAEAQSNPGIRNWAQSITSDEGATRSAVILTQAISSDYDQQYLLENTGAMPGYSTQQLNLQTKNTLNFINSRSSGAKTLEYELIESLGNMYGNEDQGRVLARNLISETLRNATQDPKNFRDLASQALLRAGINPSSDNGQHIIQYLDNTYGADLENLSSKAKNHLDQNTSAADRNLEIALLKQGIDPQTNLGKNKSWENLSKELGLDSKKKETFLAQTQAQLTAELRSETPNFARIHHLQQLYEHLLPGQEIGVWTRGRVFLSNARSSATSLYINSVDALYEMNELLPQNQLRNAFFKISEQLQSSFAITIKDNTGKIIERIPLFGLKFWIIDKVFNFRKTWTHSLLKSLRGKSGLFNNTFRFALRNYAKGGYSAKFMWNSIGHETLNVLAKSGGKYASWGALKTAITKTIVAGVSKISVKLAAAIGGALESGGTTLIIGLVMIAFDIVGMGIKWAWNNKDKVALGIGSIGVVVGSFFASSIATIQGIAGAAINFVTTAIGSISNILFSILSATATSLAGGIVAGTSLLMGFNVMQNIYTLPPSHIDSGVAQMITSVICEQSKENTSNATANVALCIADLAYKCPGVNPMTESSLKLPSWQCFAGGLVFKKAIAQLEISSHISNGATGPGNVQCVGLDNAAAADGDGAFSTGQKHACSYATINKPSGYQYLPGCPGIQPGDHFIMGVDKCVSTGGSTVGHIGVVIEPDGGVGFTCVDANYSFGGNGIKPGEIRGPDKCHFAISEISGCLRKI